MSAARPPEGARTAGEAEGTPVNAGIAPTAQLLEQQLRAVLQPTRLQVIDESAAHAGHAGANGTGSGTHFRVRIAAPQFAGMTRVQRHRLVYDALQNHIAQGLHALAIEILPE